MLKELFVNNCVGTTGGVSLTYVLATMYESFYWHGLGPNEEYHRLQVQKQFNNNSRCVISGHIFYDYIKIKSWGYDKVSFFTMLREPIKRITSAFFWSVYSSSEMGTYLYRKTNVPDFRKWCQGFDNSQIRYLLSKSEGNITKDDLSEAKYRLERDYVIVGLTERYNESLYMMYKKLHWPRFPYYYYAAGVKTNIPQFIPRPNESDIEYVTELNKYDIELYDYAKKRFESSLHTLTSEEQAEMNLFVSTQNKVDEGLITITELLHQTIEELGFSQRLLVPNVYIFGAGLGGQKMFNFIRELPEYKNNNIVVKGFIDNSKEKQNTIVNGLRVTSLAESNIEDDDCIIIASLSFHAEMENMLLNMGIPERQIIFPEDILRLFFHAGGITQNDVRRNAPFYATADTIIPDIVKRYYDQLVGKIVQVSSNDKEDIGIFLNVFGDQRRFFLQALAKVVEVYPVKFIYWNFNELESEYYEKDLLELASELQVIPGIRGVYYSQSDISVNEYNALAKIVEKNRTKCLFDFLVKAEKSVEPDIYVIGNIMVDNNKYINQLLNQRVDLNRILELY